MASLLVAPLLLLSACGSDSSGGSDAPSKPSAADVALAKSSLLTVRDFPKGWKASAAADDASAGGPADPNRGATFAGCTGGDNTASSSATADAASPSFTNAKDEEVSFEVAIAPDEKKMSSDFDLVDGTDFEKCITSAAEEGLKEGMKSEKDVTLGKVAITKPKLGALGDRVVTYRVTVPITASGIKVDTTLDFAFVQVGRAALFATGTRFSFGEMSPKEFTAIVAKATKRLDRTLASAK